MGGYGKVKESNFLKAIWPEERLESRACKIVFNRYSNFSASESRVSQPFGCQSAASLLMTPDMRMLILTLTISKLEACSPPSHSSLASKGISRTIRAWEHTCDL